MPRFCASKGSVFTRFNEAIALRQHNYKQTSLTDFNDTFTFTSPTTTKTPSPCASFALALCLRAHEWYVGLTGARRDLVSGAWTLSGRLCDRRHA